MSGVDKMKNKAEELSGKGKEAVGEATDDRDLQAEGQADQVSRATSSRPARRSRTPSSNPTSRHEGTFCTESPLVACGLSVQKVRAQPAASGCPSAAAMRATTATMSRISAEPSRITRQPAATKLA